MQEELELREHLLRLAQERGLLQTLGRRMEKMSEPTKEQVGWMNDERLLWMSALIIAFLTGTFCERYFPSYPIKTRVTFSSEQMRLLNKLCEQQGTGSVEIETVRIR